MSRVVTARSISIDSRSLLLPLLLLALLAAAMPASAEIDPQTLADVDFEQRLGETLPKEAAFKDSQGNPVVIGDLLQGEQPLLLAPVYYNCPNLCGLSMEGIAEALEAINLRAGRDFRVVLFSIDPREGPQTAAERRASLADKFPEAGVSEGWTLLTGEPPAIDALTEAIGFKYAYDEELGQYAHTAGIVLITPRGRINGYQFGVRYRPRDIRLGLLEAGQGEIGSMLDQVLLLCYDYDPRTGEYSLLVMQILRLAGLATLVLLGGAIGLMVWREGRRRRAREASASGPPESRSEPESERGSKPASSRSSGA